MNGPEAADLLRRAADALVAMDSAASGPWCFHGGDLWKGDDRVEEMLDEGDKVPAEDYREDLHWPYPAETPYSGHNVFAGDVWDEADARLIAALRPAARLLPVVLRYYADGIESLRYSVPFASGERALIDLAERILHAAER